MISGLSEADKTQHRGNFLFILQHLVGSDILIRTRDGGEIQGIFNTATPFDTARGTEVVIKMAKVKGGKKVIENGSTVVVSINDIAAIEVVSLDFRSSRGELIINERTIEGSRS